MSGFPTVAIVVPVIETETYAYWKEFAESVDAQTFDARKILVVHMVRYSESKPNEPKYRRAAITSLYMKRGAGEPISAIEQYGIGMQHVIDEWPSVQHIMCSPANDVLAPDCIEELSSSLSDETGAVVSVPGFMYCDKYMNTIREHFWDDDLGTLKMVETNHIPDVTMFTRDVYGRIPFDPKYGRASFWIWWIKLFMVFGRGGFSFVRKPLFLYRAHGSQISGNRDYTEHGKRVFEEWCEKAGLDAKSSDHRSSH